MDREKIIRKVKEALDKEAIAIDFNQLKKVVKSKGIDEAVNLLINVIKHVTGLRAGLDIKLKQYLNQRGYLKEAPQEEEPKEE